MHYTWCAEGPDLLWYQIAGLLKKMQDNHIHNAREQGMREELVAWLENDLKFLELELKRLRRHYYAEDLHG